MEKPFKENDEQLRNWMKELPLDKPSPDFTNKVMGRIQAKSATTKYTPLISKRSWYIIGLIFLGASIWLYFNPSTQLFANEQASLFDGIQFNNPFEALQLSRTSLYAIAFLALFMVQIPFLKRLVEKNYIP